jgi:uncharacterized caspase-like protein
MFPKSILCKSLIVATLMLAAAPVAHAEKRLALVIGQSAYRSVPALPNPGNDARKMTELLGTAGFDVTAASDLTQNQMRETVGDFAQKIAATGPDTVALLFYAGHGLQIDGENYLVPVDVDPKRQTDIPLQAMRLNDVMNTLGAVPTRLRIVMLDACRNNPFPALGTGTGNGLAIVDTKAGSAGSFISYSTSPGAVAEDGNGEDSPYTTAVLNFAREPNLPIEEAFKRVRVAVNDATEGRQIPWDSSSLTTDFRFFGDQAGKPAPTTDKKAEVDKQPSVKRSVEDWRKALKGKDQKDAYQLVIADDSVPAYEAFVALYAQPPYNVRVRALLERRYVMQAWAIAVATNTVASYQSFVTTYANSDLAVTARKLQDRVRNREFGPLPAAVAALGPTCPCPEPQQQLRKRVEEPAPKKQRAEAPKERKQPAAAGQKEEGIPPEAIGIGIGIGLGMGGGMGGGGGGGRGGGGMSGSGSGHSYGR